MNQKEQNRALVQEFATQAFWQPELREKLLAADVTMDFPNAPPGMPQNMDTFDTRMFLKWLGRTVSSYEASIQELYGTPDPNVFWVVGEVKADVLWGWEPGKLETRMFSRVELRDGKVGYVKAAWNPLKFLEAANLEIPLFKMDLQDGRVMGFLAYEADGEPYEAPTPAVDTVAAKQRMLTNLELHRREDYTEAKHTMSVSAPDCTSAVWFLPPEMRESYSEQEMPYVEAWTNASCHSLAFAPEGKWWETDDPYVYFAEFMCDGEVDWIGNSTSGAHYRNRYFYIYRFDEFGRVTRCEEVLNPINKFNSIGVSLPSFPYYFR